MLIFLNLQETANQGSSGGVSGSKTTQEKIGEGVFNKYWRDRVPSRALLTRRDLECQYLRCEEPRLAVVIFELTQGELLDLTQVPRNTKTKKQCDSSFTRDE